MNLNIIISPLRLEFLEDDGTKTVLTNLDTLRVFWEAEGLSHSWVPGQTPDTSYLDATEFTFVFPGKSFQVPIGDIWEADDLYEIMDAW